MTAELVGLKEASTFTGFCQKHDSETFAPLERRPFRFEPEQCFLLAYRGFCREIYAKIVTRDFVDGTASFDRGKALPHQVQIQDFRAALLRGFQIGLPEMADDKRAYDSVLTTRNFSTVEYYGFEIDRCPDVVCCGFFTPTTDFQGNRLQNRSDLSKPLDHASFSLIPTDTGGAAVFVWVKKHAETVRRLVKSLDALPDKRKPEASRRLAFECLSNVYFSPDWWDALTEAEKAAIREQFSAGTLMRPNQDLTPDGLRVVSWQVTARHTTLKP